MVRLFCVFLSCVLSSSCVTINIHFPAKEIEDTADDIVNEVREEPETKEESPGSTAEPDLDSSFLPPTTHLPGAEVGAAGLFITVAPDSGVGEVSESAAPDGKEGDRKALQEGKNDPVVAKITKELKGRFPKLRPFYEKKALGENRKGLVEVREDEKLSLKQKRTLKKLVSAENKNRMDLYKRLAVLNKVDSSRIKDIQAIFAMKWIEKARKGWWVQDEKGRWIRKPTGPKKKKKK